MSKPRRPKYQRPVAKPVTAQEAPPASPTTETPAVEPTLVEPVLDQADEPAPTFEQIPEPAFQEAGLLEAAYDEVASDEAAPAIESLPAPVADIMPPTHVPAVSFAAPSPRALSTESIGTTVMNYFIGEGEAFAAHMRALAGARTMADYVRIQIGEFQRAADSTLTCWGLLTMSASRSFSAR